MQAERGEAKDKRETVDNKTREGKESIGRRLSRDKSEIKCEEENKR